MSVATYCALRLKVLVTTSALFFLLTAILGATRARYAFRAGSSVARHRQRRESEAVSSIIMPDRHGACCSSGTLSVRQSGVMSISVVRGALLGPIETVAGYLEGTGGDEKSGSTVSRRVTISEAARHRPA